MIWKRLQNLWALSGMEIAANTFREVTLSVPSDQPRPSKKLASIIEIDKKDYFK